MGPTVLIAYWRWHYTVAPQQVFVVWRDLTWFVLHLFSVPLLLRTLFSPWKRVSEDYNGGGIEGYFEVIVFNVLSRVVGATVRLPIIILGSLVFLCMLLGLVVVYVAWMLAPVLIASSFFVGAILLYG